MIGLGSNRLTVCRRGGMSVTQAGKGGMEWLAGGRVPSWASPYSVQATAALLAQFPTQWPTIRDYGFAHPALVPFINEDPMLVMSLIEGLGERWLISDGSAYIDCGIKPFVGIHMIAKYAGLTGCVYTGFGARNAYQNKMCASQVNYNEGGYYFDIATSRTVISGTYIRGQELYAEINDITHKAIFRNTTYNISDVGLSDYNIYIFGFNTGGSITNNGASRWKSFEIVGVREMYPFIRKINGVDVCGMIDVLSGTFYQNAGSGSFTISETPAS